MKSDLGYLYHLHIADCDETWYRHPILKLTPKTIMIGNKRPGGYFLVGKRES